ncbi:MAG: hypothetical protein JO332_01995, partial [Planctomycetaceae bacterium]|nr:hypothetical protein [Planctomycetaceae bacterium]
SLGIMLYEAIAGQPPFGGKNPVETLSKVVEGTTVRPSQAAPSPGGDPVLDAICMKSIARDPKERYATAADLAKELTRWLDQGQAAPKSRYPAGQIAILAALCLVLIAVLFWNKRAADRREAEIRADLDATMKKIEAMNVAIAAPPVVAPLESFKQRSASVHNGSTPAKMSFYSPGLFEGSVHVSHAGDYEVLVTASCTEAQGELAKFRVTIDDQVLGDVLLTSLKPTEYSLPAHLAAGERKLGIEFINDFFDKATNEDRNLFIHHIALHRQK